MGTIAVIDYGMGNLRSVAKALEHVAERDKIVVSNELKTIQQADRIVFPGQGAMAAAMHELQSRDLVEILKQQVRSKPFLGICLGLQALISHSDEDGGVAGLDILSGQAHHFKPLFEKNKLPLQLKIPHMGWNQVSQTQAHPLWHNIAEQTRFYFVHSYYVQADDAKMVSGVCNYGGDFTAAAAYENLFAVQFHPEKSQRAGLQLLRNFLSWNI